MTEAHTLASLAREASDAFEQGTRADGETFRRVRDDAPRGTSAAGCNPHAATAARP
jgi:hypothetical protein